MYRAVFLDRDGVINRDAPEGNYLTSVEEIIILPRVPEALNILKKKGYSLIVVSNQGAIAREFNTFEGVEKMNEEINRRIFQEVGIKIDAFYFCPHHPKGTIPEYAINCNCRKPSPGMLLEAAKRYDIDLSGSYMVGDRTADVVAGKSAGCKTFLVKSPKNHLVITSNSGYDIHAKPDFIVEDLYEASQLIARLS